MKLTDDAIRQMIKDEFRTVVPRLVFPFNFIQMKINLLLSALFIAAKLVGLIGLSWLAVTAPTWLAAIISLYLIVFSSTRYALIQKMLEKSEQTSE